MKSTLLFFTLTLVTTISFAQNIGIGTSSPKARLHVLDSSVLFSLTTYTTFNPGDPPISGKGRRFMWYAPKAAFRAGRVESTNWDKDSVGEFSTVLGMDGKASGPASISLGRENTASGENSIAMGFLTEASGLHSVALGWGAKASGGASAAFGEYTEAAGRSSTAFGLNTLAEGSSSLSAGYQSVASGQTTIATGYRTMAAGWHSVTTGFFTIARGTNSLVTGMWNDPILGAAQAATTSTTPLFIIGNGDDNIQRSNAMMVRKDGRIGVGTNTPLTTLHVRQVGGAGGVMLENETDGNKWRIYSASGDNNLTFFNNANVQIADIDDVTGTYSALSDARYKKDIEAMNYVMPRLTRLAPKSYHFNWQSSSDQKEIGMLAQDTYALFPELVSYDKENDLYKMNYAGFSTVAIKAIQEQQQEINNLKQELQKQQQMAKQLEEKMQRILNQLNMK